MLASPENENHHNLAHPSKAAFLTVDLPARGTGGGLRFPTPFLSMSKNIGVPGRNGDPVQGLTAEERAQNGGVVHRALLTGGRAPG